MLNAIEAFPYIQVKRSDCAPLRIIFQRGGYRERLPVTFREFLSQYRCAMQTTGLSNFQIRQVLQSCAGTIGHVLQIWHMHRPARSGSPSWAGLEGKCVADMCAAGGWLPAAPLLPSDLEMLFGAGSDFDKAARRGVLRKALVHSGYKLPLASLIPPTARRVIPAPVRWMQPQLDQFRHSYPDVTPEGTAVNIMLWAQPAWDKLLHFSWPNLARLAEPGSNTHRKIAHCFSHIPLGVQPFMQYSPGYAATVQQLRTRLRSACMVARVPDLTPHCLRFLNAEHIAGLMFP